MSLKTMNENVRFLCFSEFFDLLLDFLKTTYIHITFGSIVSFITENTACKFVPDVLRQIFVHRFYMFRDLLYRSVANAAFLKIISCVNW